MTYSEAKKLKTGDKVVIKAINKSVEVAEIKEKNLIVLIFINTLKSVVKMAVVGHTNK